MQFEDLAVWKESHHLTVAIYKLMANYRDFGFKDQITRSALSISSNIAEGYERFSIKDKINFLYYAKASSAELRSQLYVAIDINYISKHDGEMLKASSIKISKMLQGLINA
ncbi:four helix bundle protein [Thalassotalea litorea]|uniref:Four helix bundle protein n=1 Tax=Thalassotalea litorea TaxID=2020715 RepID=A0A5R9IHS8_9GAMM|nr:four helix bundle protein [Thalassotalea litorea]TLU65075.1 four helix bundle protein [Thalassotalea litorea]